MRSTRTVLAVAATAAAALTLSSCGMIGGQATPTQEDSPLTEFFAALYGSDMSPEDWEEQYAEQEKEAQDIIAACMQAEGFEYIPETGSSSVSFGDDVEWNPDDRDWVAQYGYGVFNNPWNDQPQEEQPVDEWVDPNADYVESLSEAEQTAYYEVLHGGNPTDEQLEDPDFDWSTLPQGCWGEGYAVMNGGDEMEAVYEQFEPLMERMFAVYDEAQNAPEMIELDAEWSSCMADSGYAQYTKQSEVEQSFYDKQEPFWEAQNEMWEGVDWDTITEEEIEQLEAQTSDDPMQSPEWAEAAEEEIATALADFDCREKLNYRETQLEIQFELEERFINDNRADLEAFRSAAEQAS
ncbi:hypothetical protein [Microbacterium amylolyticum]|uniref:Uncharacterized protein n=1 Tax=Microbacterium amylolyticum TaxID=936337 RepID=A0ABS4ZFM5_9MICO|nr:hypothetical protein [Microbacterium amylolyticum]MBP2436092.1 hypothetical protein [Microbacterium amylolyticum]